MPRATSARMDGQSRRTAEDGLSTMLFHITLPLVIGKQRRSCCAGLSLFKFEEASAEKNRWKPKNVDQV